MSKKYTDRCMMLILTCDGKGIVIPGLFRDVEDTWNHALHPARQATDCREKKQKLSICTHVDVNNITSSQPKMLKVIGSNPTRGI